MADDSNKDLVAASVWAVTTLAAVALTQSAPVRFVLAVPLVLFVTGHVLLRALGLSQRSLPVHCAYAIGASIGICLVGGIVLDLVRALTPLGWSVWLMVATVGLALLARWRHGERGFACPSLRLGGFRPVHGALLGAAVMIGCSAYAIAVRGAAMYRPFTYTEFWMVPAAPDEPHRLIIGVENAEPERQSFDVEVTLDSRLVGLWRSVSVAPGATWLAAVNVRSNAGGYQKAEARLYRSGHDEIYRRVSAVVPGA